jgi:probable F420-dependent oxidoreductase
MTHPFRFGMVAAMARSGEEWAAKARRAESLGFATLLTPDTLQGSLAPLPAIAAAAAATTTLRVGTYVIANDLRHPILLAQEAATVDFLSGGRLELGVGAGRPSSADDLRMLGRDMDPGGVRVARLAESLALVRQLLEGRTVTAAGEHYTVTEARVAPRPVQQPRPPLLVAATGPKMLELAAREADIVALGLAPTSTEAAAAETVDRLRRAAGRRFEQLELNVNLMAVGDQVPRYVASQMGPTAAEDLGRMGALSAATGTPDEMCAVLLRRRETLGISYYCAADELAEAMAPVVERLAGR